MKTTEQRIVINYCGVNRLFAIERNGEDIHEQPTRPNETDIIESLKSDNWTERFKDMREGKKVRVSSRIYFDMLGAVPPIKQTATSFFCGEPYSGNLHYYFSTENGKRYAQLKAVK